MSDAYHIEPSAPGGGAVVQGLDSPAASAAQAGAGRRISANSFKLLTAKLKKAPVHDLVPSEHSRVIAPPASVIEQPIEAVQSAEVAEVPPPPPVTAAERSIEAVQTVEALEEPAPPPVELPQFQPIDFYVPKPEVAEEQPQAAEPERLDLAAVQSAIEVDANLTPLPEFVLQTISFGEPETETPPAPAEEQQPEPELQATEFAVHTLAGDEPAADEPALEQPVVEQPELDEPAEIVAQPEPVTVAPELVDETAGDLEAAVVEAAVEPQKLAPDTSPAIVSPDTAAPQKQEEAKPKQAELADRVVEAMIKTISTAVYAKPSASERAAFLREMAEVMEQEALANGEAAPAVPEPVLSPIQQPAPSEPVPEDRLADALASRIGPAAALLKPKAGQGEDPFAQNLTFSRFADPKPSETVDADEESGELAITLLDMMSGGSGTALPHERTLAADTLLRILPRIPVKQLLAVVERVAIMETPPALLVAKLIRDSRHEVVAPLLERCSHISDQDLMNAAPDGDAPKLRMIARRRILSTVLSDYLISIGEPGVLLTLIRNPGAAISHDAFFRLAEYAAHHHSLLAPLATRADLPPPVAFELFWHVPQELRRFIFSRFLTDSETLNKILRITLATHADASNDVVGEGKFPSREAIEAAVEHAANFRLEEASRQFAEIGSIAKDTALRILSDREGEPITVLFKALGYPRSKFEEALGRLRHTDSGILRPDRNPEEMQAIFDSLSFNKARILLTYWDWFVRRAGPYAPHN